MQSSSVATLTVPLIYSWPGTFELGPVTFSKRLALNTYPSTYTVFLNCFTLNPLFICVSLLHFNYNIKNIYCQFLFLSMFYVFSISGNSSVIHSFIGKVLTQFTK